MKSSEKANSLNIKGLILLLSILLFSSKVFCDIVLQKNTNAPSQSKAINSLKKR